ncbi:MAG: hypothetical protein ABEJ27_05600 [Halodesulfurarchaeum sp.]
MERAAAVEAVERVLRRVEEEQLPVPVQELWVYGDAALGLDPIDRLDIYVAKDLLFGEAEAGKEAADLDVKGVGSTVRAAWARKHPEWVRTNEAGYAAPERCLAAHLLDGIEGPVHLEVCNSGFENNVTQRLEGAIARDAFEEVLDPRGVCLWLEGARSEDALEKLRAGELVFPTLPDALEMLGADAEAATRAAKVVGERRALAEGTSVRGDVV